MLEAMWHLIRLYKHMVQRGQTGKLSRALGLTTSRKALLPQKDAEAEQYSTVEFSSDTLIKYLLDINTMGACRKISTEKDE